MDSSATVEPTICTARARPTTRCRVVTANHVREPELVGEQDDARVLMDHANGGVHEIGRQQLGDQTNSQDDQCQP